MRMYIYILLHIYFYMYICVYVYIYIHTFAVLDISLYPQIIQCHHIIPLYSHELLHNLHVMHDMSNSPPFLSYIYIYILQCLTLTSHRSPIKKYFDFRPGSVVQKLSLCRGGKLTWCTGEIHREHRARRQICQSGKLGTGTPGTPKIRRKHDWTLE